MFSKRRTRFCFTFLLLAATLFAFAGAASATCKAPNGVVEDATPGVFAARNGKWVPIAVGSDLYEFESIATNAIGYAALRFKDDTLLELGPNSVAHLMFAIFEPDRAMFQVHMDKGEARFGTGSIGLKNPRGIKFVTPKNIFITRNCIANFLVSPEAEVAEIEWMPEGVEVSVINAETKSEFALTAEGAEMVTDAWNDIVIVTPQPGK